MKKNLVRQDHRTPDSEKLHAMLVWLDNMMHMDANVQDKIWLDGVREIISFRDTDGSFSLLDSFCVEGDSCFDFCRYPHHMATAVLMRAILEDRSIFNMQTILLPALKICYRIGLQGHGYDNFSGILLSVKAFQLCGLHEFLRRYSDLCPEFTEMMNTVIGDIAARCSEGKFSGAWGEDHEADIRRITETAQKADVFVYGTLLTGQTNHKAFLSEESSPVKATVTGYDMYDIGHFPGIVRGNGKVKGEVYSVKLSCLKALDRLEGEGSLYIRKPVLATTENGEKKPVLVYVYNGSVKDLPCIPFEVQPYRSGADYSVGHAEKDKNDLIWYVSYGSNMLEERFNCYLQGGICRYNGRPYNGCTDKTPALRSKPVVIPYNMYFANESGSWSGSAVSFLDVSRPGKAYGRAWLIHKEQLEDIHREEGNGRNWYPDLIDLEPIDHIRAVTFSNKNARRSEPTSKVSSNYLAVLFDGMTETYPALKTADIIDYLRKCGR